MANRNPNYQQEASRGGVARSESLTQEQRSLIASRAAATRWYSPSRETLTRYNAILRGLAAVAERALEQGNEDRYIRALTAMAPWERMRLWIEREKAGTAQPISMELQQEGEEAMKKFEEGKKGEVVEVVAEVKKDGE